VNGIKLPVKPVIRKPGSKIQGQNRRCNQRVGPGIGFTGKPVTSEMTCESVIIAAKVAQPLIGAKKTWRYCRVAKKVKLT